jgi:hypothetical protein
LVVTVEETPPARTDEQQLSKVEVALCPK